MSLDAEARSSGFRATIASIVRSRITAPADLAMPCARIEPLSIATRIESAVVSTVIARRTTGE
jgi:hypothetical protein